MRRHANLIPPRSPLSRNLHTPLPAPNEEYYEEICCFRINLGGFPGHCLTTFLFSRRRAGQRLAASRHPARPRQRPGGESLRRTDRRIVSLDQLAVLRNAKLPDFPVIRLLVAARLGGKALHPVAPLPRQPALRHDAGFLHHVPVLQVQVVQRALRRAGMGFLNLLYNPHRRRPYLEIRDAGLHTAYHRRPGALLPRPIPRRRGAHRPLRGAAIAIEPSADDLLFPLRGAGYGHSMAYQRRPPEGDEALGDSDGLRHRCRAGGRGCQRHEPL